jgi:FecR protein
MRKILSLLGGAVLAAAFVAPARADVPRGSTANPGAVNYIEGQASIGSEALSSSSVGSAQLQAGQSIATGNGKVELLLTPGVFMRLGSHSSLTMISPDLTDTEVQLNQGEATLEVDQIYKENDIRVAQENTMTRIMKRGFYDFDADEGQIRVLDGQTTVSDSGREVKVKSGHEVDLNTTSGPLKARSFEKNAFTSSDDLYRWSSLRSAYVAEANVNEAPYYGNAGWYGPGWIGAGWYWDPWFSCYTFIPGDGIFWSPFGWGFYSPGYVGRAALYGYYGYGGRYYHRFSDTYRPAPAFGAHSLGFRGGVHGGFEGGEFQGGGSGGGFHGGGFAGGGFGGGHGR